MGKYLNINHGGQHK